MQELKATGDTDFPYVLIDADGTSHYFYKDADDNNKLKDEDGLGLTITQTSSNNVDAYSIMSDKNGMEYVFGIDNYLRQIKDPCGNVQKMQYGPHADGNYFGYVDDPTGARLECIYTDDMKFMDHINVNDRKIYFTYDASGHLTKITYPDGKVSEFGYNGDKLAYAKTVDGVTVSYQYVDDCGVARVSEVRETAGTVTGRCMRITYDNGTTKFEEAGLDGNIENTADNRVFTYSFNQFGSPVSIADDEGHVSSFQRYEEGVKRHKLRQAGVTGKTVYNCLRNPGFDSTSEFADAWGNSSDRAADSTWGVERKTDRGYFHDTSIYVRKNNTSDYASVSQQLSLAAGMYTLSAYAYVKGIPEGTGKGAGLAVKTADSVIHYGSEYRTGTSDEDIDRGRKRVRMTFTISSAQVVTVMGGIFKTTGEAWFDCFQLEDGDKANRYNMVYNSRFARGIEDWRIQNAQTGDGAYTDAEKGSCLKLGGTMAGDHYAVHAVYTSGEEGDVYSFGCFVKADAIPGKTCQIGTAVIYDSGEPKWERFDVDPYRSGWQYVSGIISTDDENSVTKRTYNAIHLYLFHEDQANPAYFTDVQLMKDDGPSYTYDDQGNLNTASRTAEKQSFHYGEDNRLQRLVQMDGTAFEYAYDAKKLLTYAKSTEGVRSSYIYNDKGLPVAAHMQADKMSASVTVGRKYFIRQKKSGKYLDTHQGDVNGSNIHQYQFNGSVDQTWKVEDAGDGYVKFIVQAGTATRALDVANGADADGTNVQLYDDDGTVAQKFRLKPLAAGGYQILAKCSNDRRAVEVAGGSLDNMGNVQIRTAGDEPTAEQIWYFEPADEGAVSAVPQMEGRYRIRVRHSGQYLALEDDVNAVGKKLQQKYYEESDTQQFMLWYAQDGYLQIRPYCAMDKCIDISTTGNDGYYRVTLGNGVASDSKSFKFVQTGTGYAIENKTGLQFDVMNSSFVSGTDIIGTGTDGSALANNKIFIFEECGPRMASEVTYTADGRTSCSLITDRVSFMMRSEIQPLTAAWRWSGRGEDSLRRSQRLMGLC